MNNNELTPMELLRSLFAHKVLLGLCVLLCAGAALVGTWLFADTRYSAQVLLCVSNYTQAEAASLTSSDLSAAQKTAEIYAVLVTARPFLEDAASAAGISADAVEVTAECVGSTPVLRITVAGERSEKVFSMAYALAELFPAWAGETVSGTSCQVVQWPSPEPDAEAPDFLRAAATGLILGLLLGTAIIAGKELLGKV